MIKVSLFNNKGSESFNIYSRFLQTFSLHVLITSTIVKRAWLFIAVLVCFSHTIYANSDQTRWFQGNTNVGIVACSEEVGQLHPNTACNVTFFIGGDFSLCASGTGWFNRWSFGCCGSGITHAFNSCLGFCANGYDPVNQICLQPGECTFPMAINPATGVCEFPFNLAKNNGPSCPALNNPINAGTGNKFQLEVDYAAVSAFGLSFQRFYNSNDSVISTRIGQHWRGNYDRVVEVVDVSTVEIIRDDGKVLTFNLSGNNWVPDADITAQLVELTDGGGVRTGWRYTTSDDTVEDYNIDGQLITITNRAGLSQTLSYDVTSVDGGDDNSDTLDKVTGPFGRTLSFTYDGNGRIATMTDPGAGIYTYGYDANGNLLSVAYPDETPGNSTDNPQRQYHYENVSFLYALTGITDETGARFSTYAYDTQGRANMSEHAGGDGRVNVVFNIDGTSTVTDAIGNVRTYHFDVLHGVVKIAQIDGGPCTSCGQIQNTTYDANGFIASQNDFNGNVTTFVNDARGLELSRTEAVGTSEQRTITTEWHPTFRLPTMITEPGKITTFTYDAQGRLLSRKVSAP